MRVIIHYPSGEQIAYSCPTDVEIADNLNEVFKISSQKLADTVFSVEFPRVTYDYVLVLVHSSESNERDVYVVPIESGQKTSIDKIRGIVCEVFGPDAVDKDSLRAYENPAAESKSRPV